MDIKKKLVELQVQFVEGFCCGDCIPQESKCRKCLTEKEADYLIANGVTMRKAKPIIDPADADFGTVLVCAVRYAIGQQTYMPKIVVDYIRPLLPLMDDHTLWAINKDIDEAARISLGDPIIDEPVWRSFHESVKNELHARPRKAKGEVRNDSK